MREKNKKRGTVNSNGKNKNGGKKQGDESQKVGKTKRKMSPLPRQRLISDQSRNFLLSSLRL